MPTTIEPALVPSLKATDHNNFFRQLLEELYDGVYFVDRERKITYWNRGAERLTGYRSEEVLSKACYHNLLMHTNPEGCNLCHGGCPLEKTMSDGQAREEDLFLRHREGHRVPVRVRVTPIRDGDGEIVGGVEVFSDNTARMAALDRASELEVVAFLDALTQVGNRRYAESTLESRHMEFQRYGWRYGVLLIDVDHFKGINDRWGHAAGDEMLKMVARTLANNMRPFDFLGRWGGDEFLAILPNVDEVELAGIAERCQALVSHSVMSKDGHGVGTTISVGGSVVQPGEDTARLLARADAGLYKSKQRGRNNATVE